MYHRWLDRWDERRAVEGELGKNVGSYVLDGHLAFSNSQKLVKVSDFSDLALRAMHDKTFFDPPSLSLSKINSVDGFISFPSAFVSSTDANNIVVTKLTQGSKSKHAVVVFHQWNARKRQPRLAAYLANRGISVAEMALPYHLERSRRGATHSDFMLSANLGRTIASFRQAVWDGRNLVQCLRNRGYQEISVLGFSLGAWIAGIVAAHDDSVEKASLFLPAGSLADMVWTGRATRQIRMQLEASICLADLNAAWRPLNLEDYSVRLARNGLALQVVVAERDKVVLPCLSERLIARLRDFGAEPDVVRLNCGHYSIARLPYVLFAGTRLASFLRGS